MKTIKTVVVLLIIGAVVGVFCGCGGDSEEAQASSSVSTVSLGNISLDISAAGNLALSHTEDLTVDLFYQQGTVSEVLVEEGDEVVEGQVLVEMDADEWQEQMDLLEDALTASQSQIGTEEDALADAQRQVTSRELALAAAERNVTTREIQLQEAELDLAAAEDDLLDIDELQELQERIDYLEALIEHIQLKIVEAASPSADPNDYYYWSNQLTLAEQELEEAIAERDAILSGSSQSVSDAVAAEVIKRQLAVQKAELALESAQDSIVEAELAVADAEDALEKAQDEVENARDNLADAEADADEAAASLEEAQAMSPQVTAPFDGFISKVNVAGGDTAMRGTVAVQLADPDQFEAIILVSEIDIFQLEIGDTATIEVDALDGMTFPATVTSIAPTATIQSGVVNYEVTVQLQSMEAITGNMGGDREMTEGFEPGEFTPPEGMELPEDFEMPEDMEMPEGADFGDFSGGQGSEGQLPSTLTLTDYQLREGLTVTVSITIDERQNVLVVPNGAVNSAGGQYYVEVVTASGETEQRVVEVGISDWQNTEVTSGLEEGEEVVVTSTSSSSSSSQQFSGGGGGMIIPDMGGF